MKKKLLILLLAAATAATLSFSIVGCSGGNDNGGNNGGIGDVGGGNSDVGGGNGDVGGGNGDVGGGTDDSHTHRYLNYESNNDATCKSDGTKTAQCEYPGCNVPDTIPDVGSKLSHKFTNYVSNGDATCESDGTKTAICDYNGCNESDTIPDAGSAGHTYADGWSKDENFHWHEAKCECGNAPVEKIKHTFTGGADCVCGQKYSFTEGLKFELTADGKGYKVTGAEKELSGAVVIPYTHEGLPVTEIADRAFITSGGNTTITSFTLPDSVTKIGTCAFCNLKAVTAFKISANVTEIGDYAFDGSAIEEFEVDEDNAVYSCYKGMIFNKTLTELKFVPKNITGEITLPDTLEVIPANAFEACDGITGVNFGSGVRKIEDSAFGSCKGLEEITIPDGVTEVSGFNDCTNLKKVTLGSGVSIIGDNAFNGCTALDQINFPFNIAEIGDSAFYGCENLPSFTIIGNKLTRIGNSAFYNCTFTKVSLPASVTSMGGDVFGNCPIVSATLPACASLKNCTTLETLTIQAGDLIAEEAYYGCTKLKTLTIKGKKDESGNGTGKIGDSAFEHCESLRNVTIAEGIVEMGDYVFLYDEEIVNFELPKTLRSAGCLFGSVWSKAYPDGLKTKNVTLMGFTGVYLDQTNYSVYLLDSADKDVTSAKITGVRIIGTNAFWGCSNLTTVSLGAGLSCIGQTAFAHTNVTLINYNGTKAQWEAIDKRDGWDAAMPSSYTIKCSDGNIEVNN